MPKINATWNPNDMNGSMTLSNGNLTIVSAIAATGAGNIRATHGKTSGKWYWELKLDAGATTLFAGIASKSYPITSAEYMGTTLDALKIRAYYSNNGNKLPENVTYGATSAVGDTIGVAMNLDEGTLEFYKNGVSLGVSHTNLKDMGEVFPLFKSMGTASRTITVNFGATPFSYSIPTGFKAFNHEVVNKFLISSGDEYFSVTSEITGTRNAIPQMTSNTSPNGRAFASSVNSSGVDSWKAFDTFDNSYYLSATGTGGIGHLGYEFDKPIRIGKYTLRSTNTLSESTMMPKDWTFEGSNDGVNWTVLDTRTNQTWTAVLTDKDYFIDIDKTDNYKLYRINWTANGGNVNYTLINELKIFEFKPSRLVKIPNSLEQTFNNHGMNKGITIDLTTSKVFEQRLVVQDNSQSGSGKVFKQKIDRSKHRANKIILG
ncbi:SPRY domain-containing protein [Paenibacillus sp. UMB7766-LJ446]|uniref:SPRY domain-containing protein n=1 Tax=Paenibacillus sp. UMB7766-LJ446 TaxID=3046313 RepID=UPI00254DFF03|nr:SPRY domain-containing protein [Paenibacillus sp. UMB7766-LJ446]MDK8188846.1 SPRY domain-containing protein [Paenibacillus sp. UMB7766-LJ446]